MAVTLTADLCAIAIIASARSLGEDPIVALTGRKLRGRQSRSRCLRPAALALYEATDCHQGRLCIALGADRFGLNAVRDSYPDAFEAARRAIASSATTVSVVDNRKAASAGTVIAPPPVAQETPAPAKVDHTAAIAEAMARRRAKGDVPAFSVVGVETDKALIGATEPGGCVWPMGDPREPGYRSCQAAPLSGRMYCAEHLKKAGMKPVARVIQTVGRVADGYDDREAG